MAGQAQEPPTFEDVTVFLSRAEWDALPPPQRQLYRDVVTDTYELLTSLGYPGPKPDILHRLERGEEPWICLSPGHAQSWLEEPSSGWWPGASGYRGLQTSCPGRSTARRLRDERSREKFGCCQGRRSRFPSEAGAGVASQTQPWLLKEEAEEKPGLVRDQTCAETFTDPRERPRDLPRERNPGNAPGEPRVEELRAAVGKDHSYCLRSEPERPCRPCSLLEHDYSRRRRAGRSRGAGAAAGPERRRASRHGRMVRRAREILRRYRPYRRTAPPWRGCSGVRPPMDAAVPPWPRGDRGATSDPLRAPEGILGREDSTPEPMVVEEGRKGAKSVADAGGKRRRERWECPGTGLQGIVRDVLKVVGYMLDSMCRTFELQGFSQSKSIWPIVIQIDNLAEIREP